MKIICLIPARYGSKGIPKKNIMKIGKHPLIAYSVAAGKLSTYIEEVVVTTDSNEIAQIAEKYGANVPFLRPKEISQDNSLDIEFFKYYIRYLEDNSITVPDLIVHLSPTAPFREVETIDKAIEYMMENDEATALRSMHKIHMTPYKMFKMDDGFATPFLCYNDIRESYNLPRQTFNDTYYPNGHIDIIRPSILSSGMLHGDRIKVWETYKCVDIDTFADLEIIEHMLSDERYYELIEYMNNVILEDE